jgi:phosphoribosylformimino-5-aminoimidazole carboxamide ribotide isomerase
VGGGIRTKKQVEDYLNNGVDRVILGTLALEDLKNHCNMLSAIEREFGRERVIIALDSKSGRVMTHGWTKSTEFTAGELAVGFTPYCWGFLYTNVDVEGRMQGINIAAVNEFVSSTGLPVIVSGGVSSVEDIREIEKAGAWGVVLGKALYEGKIDSKGLFK